VRIAQGGPHRRSIRVGQGAQPIRYRLKAVIAGHGPGGDHRWWQSVAPAGLASGFTHNYCCVRRSALVLIRRRLVPIGALSSGLCCSEGNADLLLLPLYPV
jgi:hypothetical protein